MTNLFSHALVVTHDDGCMVGVLLSQVIQEHLLPSLHISLLHGLAVWEGSGPVPGSAGASYGVPSGAGGARGQV